MSDTIIKLVFSEPLRVDKNGQAWVFFDHTGKYRVGDLGISAEGMIWSPSGDLPELEPGAIIRVNGCHLVIGEVRSKYACEVGECWPEELHNEPVGPKEIYTHPVDTTDAMVVVNHTYNKCFSETTDKDSISYILPDPCTQGGRDPGDPIVVVVKSLGIKDALYTQTEPTVINLGGVNEIIVGVTRFERSFTKVSKATEDFCIEENKIPESKIRKVSPNGEYYCNIYQYSTGKGTWRYTKATIISSEGEEIATVCRNYSSFPLCWLNNEFGEFLVCGSDYQGLTLVDLESGEVINSLPLASSKGASWCHATFTPSPDGKLLAAEGCFWGGIYKVRIYSMKFPKVMPWKLVSGDLEASNFSKWSDNTSCDLAGYEEEFCIPLIKWESDMTKEELEIYDNTSDEEWDSVWTYKYREASTWTLPEEFGGTE